MVFIDLMLTVLQKMLEEDADGRVRRGGEKGLVGR